MIFTIIMFNSMISILIILIWIFLSNYNHKNREKMSPYECGFNPKNSPRINFSFQFFFISLLFILFDVEIAILLPMMFFSFKINLSNLIFMVMLLMFLLTSLMEMFWQMIFFKKIKIKNI